MEQKLNTLSFGYALAILAGLHMILIGILANLGIYTGAAEQMMKWHMFFDLSALGIFTGVIEGAIMSFIAGWIIAWTYNKFI